jgi:predicted nucleotidyltransferase
MNKDEILTLLEGVKEEAKEKYKAEIKGVFGSYAKDEATAQSDVDVPKEIEEL